MFKEQYIRDNEKLHAKETLLMEIQKKANEEKRAAEGRSALIRWGAVAAAVVLVAGAAVGIALSGRWAGGEAAPMTASAAGSAAPAQTAMGSGETEIATPGLTDRSEILTFDSYDLLFEQVEELTGGRGTPKAALGGAVMEAAAEDVAVATDAGSANSAAAPAAEPTAMEAGADYSATNVQVAGVDEADIVKTDGKYIYYTAGNQLNILQAAGKDTKLLSSTVYGEENGWWGYSSEMFLLGDRLMLITQGTRAVWVNDGAGGYDQNREQTNVLIYSVANPSKPERLASLAQSGSYVSARLIGDYAYIVTSQYVWMPVRNNPATFVPTLSADGKETVLPAKDVAVMGAPESSAYTVVGGINLKTGTNYASAKALFGGTSQVYCSGEHLLLAISGNASQTGDIHPEEGTGKNVRITVSESYTRLVLLGLKDGAITRLAAGEAPGTLLNQFAMDEYKGTFRIVTSYSWWEERIYTDGVDTYEYKDKNYNCLYTLDQELNILGKVENLAEDEWVESVRFDGDVGYFVTFRQTDPLFCVDLSNPEKPRVLDSLKIPGFSEYLHGYGKGLLLGLGYDADEESGMRKGVKLSMFDVSQKTNVKELFTEKLDAEWTVVGSNHKAILVDPDKNLVAFPADSAYYLYRYEAGKGFTQLKKVTLTADLYSWNLRGLFIGDSFYVLSDSSCTVLSLTDFSTLAQVTIPVG